MKKVVLSTLYVVRFIYVHLCTYCFFLGAFFVAAKLINTAITGV